MLDTTLLGKVAQNRPKMNMELCNGIAVKQMTAAEAYINDIFRCAAESFPEGLEYVGFHRCSPYEEFREITRPPRPRRSFELSQSDVYMVKYMFRFKGQELRPRYIFLPYINDGGIIHLKGTQYKVSPIIGGRVFNIERGKIFMWTPRARLVFTKTITSFVLNGRIAHADAVSIPLYNISQNEGSKLDATLVHYQLAEFGLQGMMKKFHNVKVKVGGPELDELIESGEWLVYASRQLPPVGRGRQVFTPSEVRIAIPAKGHKPIMDSIMGAVFYIIDNCPESIQADEMELPDLWLRLLSRFIFRTTNSERKMYEEMTAHLDSARHCMDPIVRRILAKEGIICDSIFDLFHYINLNFHDMIIHHDVGSMYNMELTVVRHILYDVSYNIFMMMFDLKKLTGDRITMEKITSRMDKLLRRDRIFNVSKHGELSADSIATDCKPFAATCNLVSQQRASTAGRPTKHTNPMADPGLLLHASQVEVSSYQMMSKSEPSGRAKANPFMYFSESSFVSQNPELEEAITALSELVTK